MSGPIPTAVPAPPPPGGFQSKGGRSKHASNLRKYGTPLPILLPSSPLHPASKAAAGGTAPSPSLLSSFSSSHSAARAIEVPTCVGVLDPASASVWVTDPRAMTTLFNRGFFGKGSLSRSEPSWRQRRLDILRGGGTLAAEQVREKRRLERKQFKIDRAAAMLEAARKAEAVLTTGQLPGEAAVDAEAKEDGDAEGSAAAATSPPSPTPSTLSLATDYSAALPPGAALNAQTFLVRPARPDANRNRGKRGFKRRPPPAPGAAPRPPPPPPPPAESSDSEPSDDEAALAVEHAEHLQLSLEEAWFLSSALGVLKILDPRTGTYLPPTAVLPALLSPPEPAQDLAPPAALFPDDPLLVSYAAYHHYRALGWVVRSGIKFCVDWLLYRRGPVFSHSAFSLLMIPVYTDAADQQASPYGATDWYAERMSWKWMNTIMRVNSLVMKTVIITYITIPSIESFPASMRLPSGGLDPRKLDIKSLMSRYTVREVSLTRFGPARRRD
ncbi:tRNA splicing endonuclease subunit sen2 [Vanrija albida]|uniref:tRNA-intron lyase n=1 Tax=Vanrija albida TaxID=181172 RepID=A0ABR3PRW3_9TREE